MKKKLKKGPIGCGQLVLTLSIVIQMIVYTTEACMSCLLIHSMKDGA